MITQVHLWIVQSSFSEFSELLYLISLFVISENCISLAFTVVIYIYRNKAIKALDERLQKSQTESKDSEEWPDLDDEKQTPQPKSPEDTVSTSSMSSKSDIVRIEVDPSSPSD